MFRTIWPSLHSRSRAHRSSIHTRTHLKCCRSGRRCNALSVSASRRDEDPGKQLTEDPNRNRAEEGAHADAGRRAAGSSSETKTLSRQACHSHVVFLTFWGLRDSTSQRSHCVSASIKRSGSNLSSTCGCPRGCIGTSPSPNFLVKQTICFDNMLTTVKKI